VVDQKVERMSPRGAGVRDVDRAFDARVVLGVKPQIETCGLSICSMAASGGLVAGEPSCAWAGVMETTSSPITAAAQIRCPRLGNDHVDSSFWGSSLPQTVGPHQAAQPWRTVASLMPQVCPVLPRSNIPPHQASNSPKPVARSGSFVPRGFGERGFHGLFTRAFSQCLAGGQSGPVHMLAAPIRPRRLTAAPARA